MQEFSYRNSININNKFESVPTAILYYKWNKYYPHLKVKETSPKSASELLGVSQHNQNESLANSYIFSTKACGYLVENRLNHCCNKITFPASTQSN